MPELPEVESVRRNLSMELCGATITEVVSSRRHRGVADDSIHAISGTRITAVNRKGKFLVFDLGSNALVIHLGMSGRLMVRDSRNNPSGPHDHVQIITSDRRMLVFQDHRRFGRVFLSPADLSALPKIGIDPLQTPLTADQLETTLNRSRTPIKSLLMRQSLIAGLGNIYASEILWGAALSPFRPGRSLSLPEFDNLRFAIADVLPRAVAAGGATLEDYRGTHGEMGNFDASFAVYGRHGKACQRCSAHIVAEMFASRITYWCPSCQV